MSRSQLKKPIPQVLIAITTIYFGCSSVIGAETPEGRLNKLIDDPPLVQMLVPGFAVRELPVDLPNLNNVRYRADGKLFALAYNGNIYLLFDTDGDGLEDDAAIFWEKPGSLRGPIGMHLTPPGYEHGNGLFVASKGKLSLIVDRDGDDLADREIVIATGWQEIIQNVDALGVAIGPDGSIYFGLGTANFANGYLLDEAGQAHYDVGSERGTILRVSPDLKSREVVCTGIRFPVGLAFNHEGDLFCTDQEGATWLANGNPRDELLHIQPGKHYGFPPRHPKHLPDVIDEPSVFDYGPQHQSTCGLFFNHPANGGRVFGPTWWAGDALVCGESRGKIFRTKLVKTAQGYVGQNALVTCLGMLTVDACVSPAGHLVVACHSGPPDWGTGPEGRGKIFRIEYADRDAPQPVAAWSSGPQEARIAFDQPLDPLTLKDLANRVRIEYGPYVSAGDRFETLKPPYKVVEGQLATHRFDLPVYGAQLAADGRTLVLFTAPQAEPVGYAITLDLATTSAAPTGKGEIVQLPAIDVGFALTGAAAEWQAAEGDATWSGWLPHVDLRIAREFTQGSAEHEPLWRHLTQPGRLTIRTQLDLSHMLRPEVQVGETLDFTLPPEQVTLTFASPQDVQINTVRTTRKQRETDEGHQTELQFTPLADTFMRLEIALETGRTPPELSVSFTTDEDNRPRPLALHRFLVPWAAPATEGAQIAEAAPDPRLAQGDVERGRAVYHSEQIGCAKCHRLEGEGGRIGPDLGNLPQRDYASVVRDILDPNATLNPDYIGFAATLAGGRTLSGVVLSQNDERLVIGDSEGKELEIPAAEVEELAPSKVSVMPSNFKELLSDQQVADLMAFLLSERGE